MAELLRHSWVRSPVGSSALVLALALPLGTALLFFPTELTLVALGLGVVALAAWLTPRPEVVLLALFLLFQDPLQILAGGTAGLGPYVKRLDELWILAVGLGCLLLAPVRRAFRARGLLLAVAGCYAGVLLSSMARPPQAVPAVIDLALFSKPFLLFAIGVSLRVEDAVVERGLSRVLLLLVTVLAAGLPLLFLPEVHSTYLGTLGRVEERMGLTVAQGFFSNTSIYAWLGVATFAVSYAAYLAFRRRLYLVAALVAMGCVLLTWRRKSLVAIAVIFLCSVVAVRARGMRARTLILLALVGLLAGTVLAPYVDTLTRKTIDEVGSGDPYANARTSLYYTSLLIAADHFPLGTGLASFGSHASRMYYSDVYREYQLAGMYGLSPGYSHYITDTFWPMVLGQGGVIALVSYLAFFCILGLAAFRATQVEARTATQRLLAKGALFLLLGSFVESMASHLYGSSLQASLLFLVVGLFWRRELERAERDVTAVADDAGRR